MVKRSSRARNGLTASMIDLFSLHDDKTCWRLFFDTCAASLDICAITSSPSASSGAGVKWGEICPHRPRYFQTGSGSKSPGRNLSDTAVAIFQHHVVKEWRTNFSDISSCGIRTRVVNQLRFSNNAQIIVNHCDPLTGEPADLPAELYDTCYGLGHAQPPATLPWLVDDDILKPARVFAFLYEQMLFKALS